MLAGVSLWLRRVLYLFAVATSAEPYLSAHAVRTVPALMRHMSGVIQHQQAQPPLLSPPPPPQLCVRQIELWISICFLESPSFPPNLFCSLESRSRV